jgi:Holliday junction resolvase-like predicted endonuclease
MFIFLFLKAITEKSKMRQFSKPDKPIYQNNKYSEFQYPNKKSTQNINEFETKYTRKKTEKEEIYISIKDIANILNQAVQEIYEIFYLLKWIEKKDNWILATSAGEKNGAKQLYNKQTKQKYVMWNINVLSNQELKDIVNSIEKQKEKNMYDTIHKEKNKTKMTDKEKKEKGDLYEAYVAKFFRDQGYYVWEHGKEKGVEDGGLDLLVKIDRLIYYVQCKNWENWKIDHNNVQATQTKIRNLLKREEHLKKLTSPYKQKILYITPKKCLTAGAYKYIEENSDILEHQVIPII